MMPECRAHGVLRAFARAEHSMTGEEPGVVLELLKHTLPGHFDAEERPGGVYEALAAGGMAPSVLARLRSDHRAFLQTRTELSLALECGEDVRPALWQLADRIRIHERREAAAAIQVGLGREPDYAVAASLSPSLREHLDPIVRAVVSRAREVPGRLATGVTLKLQGATEPSMRWAVEDTLAEAGLEFLDVRLVADGPEGLQDVTFESTAALAATADATVRTVLAGDTFRVESWSRGHTWVLDEPTSDGGTDTGPTPVEAMLAALGACTAMTLRMYAVRKGWDLGAVTVTLTHRQLLRNECLDCPEDAEFPRTDRITRTIEVEGELDPDRIERLASIADRCPVHALLARRPVIVTEIRRLTGPDP